jgi:hypothetical protein
MNENPSKLKFDLNNIFELNQSPFVELKYYKDKNYLNYVWAGWVLVAYLSETASSIIYRELSKSFLTFESLSHDEAEHAEYIKLILDQIAPKFQFDKNEFENYVITDLEKYSTLEQLSTFIVEELSLLIPVALFYKQSTSLEKKKFLRVFLKDESKHISAITTELVKCYNNASEDEKEKAYKIFIKNVQRRIKFCLIPISYLLKKNVNNDTLITKILKEIYSSTWQINHTKILLKRYYKIGKLLNPNLMYEQFVQSMDIYELQHDDLFDIAIESIYNKLSSTA